MSVITRRIALLSASIALSALPPAVAQEDEHQQIPMERLLEPGPLPDKAFGNPNAQVTVIEYASMTCDHCKKFHTETWPGIRSKYVDTGKVRFIIREFPLDPLAAAAFMLARCAGDEKWYSVIDLLFQTQATWTRAERPPEALAQTVAQAGISREQFAACVSDEQLYKGVIAATQRSKELGISSTPTFFVNGRKVVGALTLAQFEKLIDPFVAAKPSP